MISPNLSLIRLIPNSLCFLPHFHNPNESSWYCSWLFLQLHDIFVKNYIQSIRWYVGPELTNFEFRIPFFSFSKWICVFDDARSVIDSVKWMQFSVTICWIFIWTLHIKSIVDRWFCSPVSILSISYAYVWIVHLMVGTICSFHRT